MPFACCLLLVARCQLPVISCLLPVTSCLLTVVCYQLPVTSCLLPVAGLWVLTRLQSDVEEGQGTGLNAEICQGEIFGKYGVFTADKAAVN